jgi:mRNA interferase MazF
VAHRPVAQVKRGEIWTIAGGPDYAGKPRPAIIVQSNKFDATLSVTVCPLSATPVENVHARFAIAPSEANGLNVASYVMVDKVSTVPRSKVGRLVGRLGNQELSVLNRRVALFLGLGE